MTKSMNQGFWNLEFRYWIIICDLIIVFWNFIKINFTTCYKKLSLVT